MMMRILEFYFSEPLSNGQGIISSVVLQQISNSIWNQKKKMYF